MERSIWHAMGYVWSEAMHLTESFFYEYRIGATPKHNLPAKLKLAYV